LCGEFGALLRLAWVFDRMARGDVSTTDTLASDVSLPSLPPAAWARAHLHVGVLFAIAAASLALRLDIARNTSLWLDEMYTLRDVNRGFVRLLIGPNFDHPGLAYTATKLGMLLFGESDAGVRAASLAFGTATLFAVYWLAIELGFGRFRALAAVATLALAPLFVRQAVEARHYAPLMFFASLSALAVLRIEREPHRTRHYALLFGSTLATLLTHYYGVTSIAAAYGGVCYVAFAAYRRRSGATRSLVRGLTFSAGPLLLLCAGIAAVRYGRIANRYGIGDDDPASISALTALDRLLSDFSPLHAAPAVAYVAPLFALLYLAELFTTRRAAALTLLACLAVPVAGLAAMGNGIAFRPKYAIAAFVVYHLLFVAGLCSALERAARFVSNHVSNGASVRFSELLPGVAVGVLLLARIVEFPAGYSAGTVHHAGLRDYLRAAGEKTRLVCYVGYVCRQLMVGRYAVEPEPMTLEKFRKRPGVERYLVAEFHVEGEREKKFASLLRKHFGLDEKAWNALPLVELPETRYHPAVRARLVDASGASPKKPRKKARRERDSARTDGR
jgi:hypothetical protein